MNKHSDKKVIYKLTVGDLQHVANGMFDRSLTKPEVALVGNSVGDYIDWTQAIENAIRQNTRK